MESNCFNTSTIIDSNCYKSKNNYRSNKIIFRLIGRYKIAFLFFLTRLILINYILTGFVGCIKTDRTGSVNFLGGIVNFNASLSQNLCNIFDKSSQHIFPNWNYKMNKLSRLKPFCSNSVINFRKLKNRNCSKKLFVNNCRINNTISKLNFIQNDCKPKININSELILKSYETQPNNYRPGYTTTNTYTPTYNPVSRGDEFNTFVSSHYRNMGEDIVEYLNRKKIEYTESPIKYTLKFCPFCPPHRFKSDNLFKHEIFKNSGNSYCHRCGYKGSLFDFKAHMGDLPGAFDFAADPISNPFGARKTPKDPDVTISDVNKFEDNLFNNPEYKVVLEYLTKTRGLKPHVLRKYHVGAGTFKFKTMTGKLEQEKCVVFPWLTTRGNNVNTGTDDQVMAYGEGFVDSQFEPNLVLDQEEVFDYNKEGITEKLHVNRIKIRSIYDKSKIKILPRGGSWGMFGGHLIKEAQEKDSIVLSEGEFDAMSIFQETGRIAISLPNGANSLPLALLPKLEKFNEIYLWMDFDAAGQSSISHFANKLGIQRVKVVHPINSSGTVSSSSSSTINSSGTSVGKTKTLKDANEVMLNGTVDMNTYFKAATVMSHSQILSFNDIRQLVYNELSDPISTCGIKSITMPGLSNLLKGHRRGELTVWTGSTGSGKTTLLSQLSLDYCLQGVSTLWGSFEINNVRLAKTMLRQFSGRNLENNLNEFDYYANKFNELPLRFLKFHGSTNIDIVLDAMDYAVYVYDVQHIIIDNLQFMLSNYSGPSSSSSSYSSIKDVYELQNRTIEKFRRFVTNKNVHLSLVVHPRKEADGIQLGLSSVFGSVKSTQEADNVIILQNILNESRCIDVKKNRFAGLLGRVYFKFDPVSLTAQEFKVTEYLNEYIRENNTNNNKSNVGKNSKTSGNKDMNDSISNSNISNSNNNNLNSFNESKNKDRIVLSNYNVASPKSTNSSISSSINGNGTNSNSNTTISGTTSTSNTSPYVSQTSPTTVGNQNVGNFGSSPNSSSVTFSSTPYSPSSTHIPRQFGSNTTFSNTGTSSSSGSASTSINTNSSTSTMGSQTTATKTAYSSPTNPRSNFNMNTGSNFNSYRERDRNNIGLVGIDLLNLKPITQQINKMIQANYSTSNTSNTNSSSFSGDSGGTSTNTNTNSSTNINGTTSTSNTSTSSSGNENRLDGESGLNEFNSTSEENNNNNNKTKKKSKKTGTDEQENDEELEKLSMRGLTITKNSSIKEMRDFVKKNGLGELVKTAGKGILKDSIYENIRSIIPQSAILSGKTEVKSTDGMTLLEGESVMDSRSTSDLSDVDDLYPFGISTSNSLLKSEYTKVYPNNELKAFKLKYLSKLPKSLFTSNNLKELEKEVYEEKMENDNMVVLENNKLKESRDFKDGYEGEGVSTNVYYSVNYDPLLIDGVIYVDTYEKLKSLDPLFRNAKVVGVDIETTGLDHNSNQIRLIQLSVPNQPTVIVDLFKIATNFNSKNDNKYDSYENNMMNNNKDNKEENKENEQEENVDVSTSVSNMDKDNNDVKNMLLNCSWLRDMFKAKNVTKVFHNGKFDINFLRVYGFEFDGQIFDTMVASKLLVASRYISCKLTHVSERYLNIVLDKTQQYSDWSTLQLFEEQLLYSARDAFVLLPLYVILEHLLKINNLSGIAEVENKCILATSDMELNGIQVDKEKLQVLQDELKQEHLELSNNLHQQLNQDEINLNSQKQILEKLQSMNIMDKSKKKLISDTSETTLIRNSSNPIISSLREYRKANKALTAFTQKLPNHINPVTNRIYPNYNQLGAESGRFSCDGPNLQQVPREKKFRECFVASKGHKFVIADFSQIELRIAAEIANDPKMIEAYQKNVDLHSLTASILKNKNINDVNKEERQLAKAVNFGLIFGMSVNGLRMYAETSYGVKLSQKEAKEIYTSFFNNFKGILNWHNTVKNNKPTMVRTLGNRLSVFDSFSFTRSLNYPVQGTSADITKETMARLVDLVKPLGAKIIICVHDEIILEVPENNAQKALDLLIDTMVKSGEKYLKKVPVEAMGSIGDSWADKS